MGGKLLSEKAARRTAEVVRTVERWPRDVRRDAGPVRSHPVQICRFEMSDELVLPQHGPGVATAKMLRWDEEFDHTWTPSSGDLTYDDFLGLHPHNWSGDVSDIFHEYLEPEMRGERIIVLDTMRMHSKMASASGDVGAYGIAWRGHDNIVEMKYGFLTGHSDWWVGHLKGDYSGNMKFPVPVWEILTMQTPGRFWGRLITSLDHGDPYKNVTVFRPSGSGHRTLEGYDPFGPNFGTTQRVYNIPSTNQYGGAYVFAGQADDVCLCAWNMRLNRYEFVWIEPNNRGWSQQTVVTSIDFGAETYQTVDMQYPPYAPPIT